MATLILSLLLAALVVVLAAAALRWRREARAARVELSRARGAADGFFESVTHELRSPLSAVLGYQELLADGAFGPLPDAALEPLARIGRAARHLLHLIQSVVDVSQLDAGQLELRTIVVDPLPLLREEAASFREQAEERGLEVVVDIAEALPRIDVDLERLSTIVDLVFTSALRYPGEALALRIGGDDALELVLDGTTLEPDEPEDDVVEETRRVGLRLAMARRLAASLGGTLRLEAPQPPAQGCRIRLRFDAATV